MVNQSNVSEKMDVSEKKNLVTVVSASIWLACTMVDLMFFTMHMSHINPTVVSLADWLTSS